MPTRSPMPCPVLLFLSLPLAASHLSADDPVETWKMLRSTASPNCQTLLGPDAQETYTIGVIAGVVQPGDPLRIIDVAVGSPASAAGIQKGEVLWGSDSKGSPALIDACDLIRDELAGSRDLILYHQSVGQDERTRVIVRPRLRREVYPGESRMNWRPVSEFVAGGRFRVIGSLAQGSQGDFSLNLGVYNFQKESLLHLDESKIFLLDDQGAEFIHQPYAEWKHHTESLIARANALAQGMESIPYVAPPPPPPPTHYHISSSADGSYVLTPLGGGVYQATGEAQIESTVSPEYTPSEQIGQAARSIASIFDAIRIARTNKEINKLRQRAAADAAALEKLLAAGAASHLETTAPIPPGAARVGIVAFVQPRSLSPSTIKAVFVVSDASMKKEFFVTFEFH